MKKFIGPTTTTGTNRQFSTSSTKPSTAAAETRTNTNNARTITAKSKIVAAGTNARPRLNRTELLANRTYMGYVLAASYFDQSTGSAANFMSMQCWASTLGPDVQVLEPFLVHSTFGVNLHGVNTESNNNIKQKMGRLRDIFNLKKWNAFISSRKYAPLVSWNGLIKKAGPNLILVNRRCIDREEPARLCNDCIDLIESLNFSQSAVLFAKQYDFEIVRDVCVPAGLSTAQQFKEKVYGPYNPNEVVVLFESWGGIQSEEYSIRIALSDLQQCGRLNHYEYIPVSNKIIQDGRRYQEKYTLMEGYITVMVRLQYISIAAGLESYPVDDVIPFLENCYSSISKTVNKIRAKKGLKSVLLTLDCRKQGSYYFKESNHFSATLAGSADILYRKLYGNSSSLQQWDQSFDLITSFQNAGYIAMLQKHLAAASTCLVTVGTGSFQLMAENMYYLYHPRGSSCVLHISENCGGL